MIIENGGHDGKYGMKVNSSGRGQVDAVGEAADRHLNLAHEQVWSLPFEGIDPVGADDYFFYYQNTGSTNTVITDFRLESTVIGTIEVHHVTGTPAFTAGADITPVNRHLGSINPPTGVIKTDTDTTGLTNSGVLFWINADTADKTIHLHTTSNIVIPPGQAVALMWDQATGIIKGVVSLAELV